MSSLSSLPSTGHSITTGFADNLIEKPWEKVCLRAKEFNLLSSFRSEILERLSPSAKTNSEMIVKFEQVFQTERHLVEIFIRLATSYKREYYSKQTMTELIDSFLEFQNKLGQHVLPKSLMRVVPPYDQGGKVWLQRALEALKVTKNIPQQIQCLDALPSLKGIKEGEKKGFSLLHRILFQAILFPSSKNTPEMSVDRLVAHNLASFGKRKSLISYHQRYLNKFIDFSEADRVRLLKIINLFGNEISEKGTEALLYWYQTVKKILGQSYFILTSNPKSFEKIEAKQLGDIIRLLQWIVEIGKENNLIHLLKSFYTQKSSLTCILGLLEKLKLEIEAKKYPEKDLQEVLNAFQNDPLVSFTLSDEQRLQIANQFKQILVLCKEFQKCDISQLAAKLSEIQSKKYLESIDRLTLIAIGREAIRFKFNIYPYNTQILALLGLLLYPCELKGRIAQVRTGEGKSTIIALLAFYNACLGKFVDVVSSSRYLAKRDYTKYREFYALFGIMTSHICTDQPTRENFSGQIIFGTNSDFEFSVMWDSLREKQLKLVETKEGRSKPRLSDIVIVDEVDNLFIDMALNSARISIPSLGNYGWIYGPILNFTRNNLLQIIAKQDLKKPLRKYLEMLQDGRFKPLVDKIEDGKLDQWLSASIAALLLYKNGHEYKVKPVERCTWSGMTTEMEIVLVDKENTGRFMSGMRVSQGIHEFLEAKHNLKIHSESAVPASLSHPVYFQRYNQIYGLTGTMGSLVERDEVKAMYNVDTFDVPPHKKNQRILFPSTFCSSYTMYVEKIVDEVKTETAKSRPVLILIESIQETENLAGEFKKQNIDYQLLNECQAEDESFIIACAGFPGRVTIATNTAGRGTDIVLHPDSLQAGGLHVVFGFYPKNDRVEDQGFGRAARQGQPGTGRMILMTKETSLDALKNKRDSNTKLASKRRIKRVAQEHIDHNYLNTFLEKVRSWHNALNTQFQKKVLKKLNTQIKAKQLENISITLEGEDLRLAEEFSAYLQKSQFCNHFLENFIRIAKTKLLEKILLAWTEGFYNALDNIKVHEKEVDYKNIVKNLYQSESHRWMCYLNDPAQGFWNYLSRITRAKN